MKTKIALAIFVKTPELSSVKTRLAKDIGQEEATRAYELCVQKIQLRIQELVIATSFRVEPYWAIAEKEGVNSARWKDFKKIAQGEGSLGERLHHVYSSLLKDYAGVVVMGSDSPLFPLSELQEAILNLLQQPQEAFVGPTEDGGYYVFGARMPLEKDVWIKVPYSAENTCETFVKNLPKSLLLRKLNIHWDLDDLEDWHRLLKEDPVFFNGVLVR